MRAAFTLLVLALTLPAFAGVAQAADTHVDILNFSFGAALSIQAGDTVTWQNDDGAPHTVTSDGGGGPLNSGTLNNGDTYAFLFLDDGTFAYHCAVHPIAMKSSVKVARPAQAEFVVTALTITDVNPLTKEVRVSVANVGASAAPATKVHVGYRYQGGVVTIGEVDVPALASGARAAAPPVTWSTVGLVGTFTVVASADSAGQVAEHREDNNSRTATTSVITSFVPGVNVLDPL